MHVTLQISLSPADYRHAVHLLPHQARVWRSQIDEILLTIDMHRSAGRFSQRWEEGVPHILPLARSIEGARVVTVDYSEEAKVRVSAAFFGGAPVPQKDYRGGPYYAYFFGLEAATNDCVLHADSDMFFGGGSQTWMAEAIERLRSKPDVLVVAPLSGPPTVDGSLRFLRGTREPGASHAFSFDDMSSRLFLFRKSTFRERIGSLRPLPPPRLKDKLIALADGNPRADLPEHLISGEMKRLGLHRCEFLGEAPGMWSLHPPYRCEDFYRKLPDLIRDIESGAVPEEQRGDHDINDRMVDWSEPRAALRRNRVWRRLWLRGTSAVRR